MRKTKFLLGAALALCLMAFAAPSASALSIAPAGATYSGNQTTNQVFRIGTALTVTCTTARVGQAPDPAGTLAANTLGTPSTNMGVFRVRYSGCTANLTGLNYPATVTTTCDWRMAPSTFNAATGVSTGVLRTGPVTPPATYCVRINLTGTACNVDIPDQVITAGITGQNVTAANQPSPPNNPVGGLWIIANIAGGASGINWSQAGCPGLGAGPPPFAGYTGTLFIPGIWVVP